MNYIVLDCETTGLSLKDDRVITLYLLDSDGNELDLKFNPQRNTSG
jgi:DNA polymerase III epsilon subunit-like protein